MSVDGVTVQEPKYKVRLFVCCLWVDESVCGAGGGGEGECLRHVCREGTGRKLSID